MENMPKGFDGILDEDKDPPLVRIKVKSSPSVASILSELLYKKSHNYG